MGGTNAARSPERVTKSYCRWEVEVEVEVHGVILTRAMLHSRWEVEVHGVILTCDTLHASRRLRAEALNA